MAFPLPSGLAAHSQGEAAGDAAVEAIENAQPSGTRMLVALQFPFRWPGFGWSADQADWAARNIAGLEPWPEPTKDSLRRVVVADPDGEPVWWICYLSSPGWWLAIIGAIGVFILAAIAVRLVWTVLPEEMRGGLEWLVNIVPFLAVMLVMSIAMTMMPQITGEVRKRLPGG